MYSFDCFRHETHQADTLDFENCGISLCYTLITVILAQAKRSPLRDAGSRPPEDKPPEISGKTSRVSTTLEYVTWGWRRYVTSEASRGT